MRNRILRLENATVGLDAYAGKRVFWFTNTSVLEVPLKNKLMLQLCMKPFLKLYSQMQISH